MKNILIYIMRILLYPRTPHIGTYEFTADFWTKIEISSFRVFFLCHSFATTVSELSRGNSNGAGSGKGHVKSASVSSPGPSAAENSTTTAQQSDSLGARYKMKLKHKYSNRIRHLKKYIYWKFSRDWITKIWIWNCIVYL